MNAAQHVISKFGGQAAVARLIDRGPSTVQHWAKTGIIPARWHTRLLSIAGEQGIDLSPTDLIEPPNDTPSSDVVERAPKLPEASWQGTLTIGKFELPVFVLDDRRRVISRTGATSTLMGAQGGGQLEQYLETKGVSPYLSPDFQDHFIEFNLPPIVNKSVRGITAEMFLEICSAYVRAHADGALKTQTQMSIASRAGLFLAGCAKVGLIALIDEATGYQFERSEDALRLKLKLFLEEKMHQWEKTFPDELWKEFGRLTGWTKNVNQRPKYWGQLVMELVYGYLDPDVTDWLRKYAPKPKHGQNYHQWLSSQYGLKKLTEHLWMLIGLAKACSTMAELRARMAEMYGREPVQLTMYLPLALPAPATQRREGSYSPGHQISKQPEFLLSSAAK